MRSSPAKGAVAHTHDGSGRPLGALRVRDALGALDAFQVRFVAAGGQHLHGLFEAATRRRRAAQGLTPPARGLAEAGVQPGLLGGLGEQLGCSAVVAGRQRHGPLDPRPRVHLGRPARPRPRTARQPAATTFQQPRLGQPVQMVRSERARHPGRLGGLVAADLTALRRHVLVQAAPHRILQNRDRVDVLHRAILRTTQVGDRKAGPAPARRRARAAAGSARTSPGVVLDSALSGNTAPPDRSGPAAGGRALTTRERVIPRGSAGGQRQENHEDEDRDEDEHGNEGHVPAFRRVLTNCNYLV